MAELNRRFNSTPFLVGGSDNFKPVLRPGFDQSTTQHLAINRRVTGSSPASGAT
jgi:hypothetical protein